MRITLLILISLIFLSNCCSKKDKEDLSQTGNLNVYVTQNIISKDIWSSTIQKFEENNQCNIKIKIFNNANTLLEQVIKEKENPQADVLVGIDNILFAQIFQDTLFFQYKPTNYTLIDKSKYIDKDFFITPIAYSDIAIIYDKNLVNNPPETFGELQDGIWKKKLIILDPRTSSLGNATLIWSVAAFGEYGYGHFWRSIKENIFKIVPNWDEAYNMFLAKEAPLVIGFSSTPIYHIKMDSTDIYKANIPKEGGFTLIEAAGILKTTSNPELSKIFIDFLISDDFQKNIPYTKWVFPVNTNIKLPSEYYSVQKPVKYFTNTISLKTIKKNNKKWIKKWEKLILK